GAHYVAAPNPEARPALRLLHAIGAVTGWDAAGRPTFDPTRLCHAPSERLFYRGAWVDGLVPEGLGAADAADVERFADLEEELLELEGSDGRPAFTIPVELSSRDPDLLALDRLSMRDWLDREGYRAPFLRWSVRYACLDDFGGEPEDVSAWAGLHYFAARKLRSADLAGSHYLVWPEGNGRLVRALVELGRPRVRTRALATHVAPTRGGVEVGYLDVATGRARRVLARAAVVATPGFVTTRLVPACAPLPARAASPWIVANLHVGWPFEPDRAWDSVIHDADGLGYVDARHQMTELRDGTVLTYYRAYGAPDVRASRAALLAARWGDLAEAVLRDLAPAHPHLVEELDVIDVMVWGHAMPRPRPGFLGERPFDAPVLVAPSVAWAHVDQTGMALFEEALLRGVRAAEALGPALGVDVGETWT
ncbi:MAG TPA: FAD-dependent oxidoreductase, partial [Minicystis sp.]|nr:FAD-dependent oxidoreductase [Minicystis sp.]